MSHQSTENHYPKLNKGAASQAVAIILACVDPKTERVDYKAVAAVRRLSFAPVLLANCFDWGSRVFTAESERHAIMALVLSDMVGTQNLDIGKILSSVRTRSKEHRKKLKRSYRSVTFLSLSWDTQPLSLDIGSSRLTLGCMPDQGLAGVLKTVVLGNGDSWDNYIGRHTFVEVHTEARTEDGAALRALFDISAFRGLLFANTSWFAYEHYRQPTTDLFNVFTWGPCLTLHNEDDSLLSEQAVWMPYESNHWDPRVDSESVKPKLNEVIACLNRLQSSSTGDFILEVCDAYADSVDTKDLNLALSRMASVLEKLACTSRHTEIPFILSALFSNPGLVQGDLNAIMKVRNRFVHANIPVTPVRELLSLCNRYVARLIRFHTRELCELVPRFYDKQSYQCFLKKKRMELEQAQQHVVQWRHEIEM